FESRQQRVRKAMEKAGIDLLLVTNPININYLIGSRIKGYQEFQALFFTLEPGPLTLLTRFADVFEAADLSLAEDVRGWGREPEDPIDRVKEILQEKCFLNRRTGLEVPDYYLRVYEYLKLKDLLGDSLVAEPNRLIEEIKFVKSPAELAYIRKASSINDAVMEMCVESLAEGKTEFEVVADMHRTMMALGGDFTASPMNFVSGERTVYSHGLPSERRLQKGDLVHLEYGSSYRRYTCTIGRVLCLGQPTPRMREIYQVVRDACDAAIGSIKAGVPAVVPHEAAKKVIGDAGMEEYRWHLTGYGIAPGFPPMWLESIKMDGGSTEPLHAGMVLSIEPPVFIPEERLGARIIDNVLVTESGAEILSKFTRDLISV
ncbi:MAG: M24 family metallopeptidase, partial [Dehalococcoidia bacterium]